MPTPIGLHAGGGAPPYRWFVNGAPLPPPPLGLTLNWAGSNGTLGRYAQADKS